MNREEIRSKIKTAVEDEWFGSRITDFNDRIDIRSNLGLDSLDHIELLMWIEDEFGIEIPDEVCENWKTVGDVLDTVEAYQIRTSLDYKAWLIQLVESPASTR